MRRWISTWIGASFLLIGILLLFGSCASGDDTPQTTIDPAGPAAQQIQDIYSLIWWLAVVVFVLVEGALIFAIFRFRNNKNLINGRPVPVHGNTRLEIIWTIVPAVILAVIAVPTIQGIASLADRDDNAFRVTVYAQQFFWQFEYPDILTTEGEPLRSTGTMYIPEDTRIEVTLRSRDVIHSFWVPRLAGKMDTIPGRDNHMWLEADEPGSYEGQCAEYCGIGHYTMRFTVVAQTQEEFQNWVHSQVGTVGQDGEAGERDLVAQGQAIVEELCAQCHAIEGTSAQGTIGPELTGFANRDMIAGVLENNEENLRRWLANPPEVKPGTQMPNLNLSQQQIDALVAYLSTLE